MAAAFFFFSGAYFFSTFGTAAWTSRGVVSIKSLFIAFF
jgi:hypothetical protein